jgi:hypothetical protein
MSLAQVLFLLGLGFFAANVKVVFDLLHFRRRNRAAILTWATSRPRFYGLNLAIGVTLGLLLVVRLFLQHRLLVEVFGEAMMFLYYGYAVVLKRRIRHGLFQDGVWTDSGFMQWGQISATSWRETEGVTLVLIGRTTQTARTLRVPGNLYGETRRLLRDKVATHDIQVGGAVLDLEVRDERDAV